MKSQFLDIQPPSGGCVLKQIAVNQEQEFVDPAAFGRLCVETGDAAVYTAWRLASRLRAAVC